MNRTDWDEEDDPADWPREERQARVRILRRGDNTWSVFMDDELVVAIRNQRRSIVPIPTRFTCGSWAEEAVGRDVLVRQP